MISPADAERRRDLRRMKVFATGLLVLAAVVYLVARANEDDGRGWVGYVRAGAEAAMVGALADWFAVTALFRHPLGLPIPHTAIIPRRKDQIGRSLGEFVQGNFLTREVLAERLAGVHVGQRLGRWLAVPANAERAAGRRWPTRCRASIEVLDDRDVQERHRRAGRAPPAGRSTSPRCSAKADRRLRRGRPPPAAARRRAQGPRRRSSTRTGPRCASRLQQESPWWVPEPIDDRIFNKIFSGVQRFLADVGAEPDHEVRAVDRGAASACSPSGCATTR